MTPRGPRKKGVLQHRRHEKKRKMTLTEIEARRPKLVADARRIGEARRALERAEGNVNLLHMVNDLHSLGLSPEDIARTIGLSKRQVQRYIRDWKARTAA